MTHSFAFFSLSNDDEWSAVPPYVSARLAPSPTAASTGPDNATRPVNQPIDLFQKLLGITGASQPPLDLILWQLLTHPEAQRTLHD